MAKKILIARVDRIGDLILTLPMEAALKTLASEAEVSWLVEEKLQFVMDAVMSKPRALFVRRAGDFKKLFAWLREEKFDEVYAVHVPLWVAVALWLARIPRRIGVASQWYSFLFFNHRVRQRRSQALKNEAAYNLELVGTAPVLEPAKLVAERERTEQWRARLGEGFVIIHPGMAGSARNWPVKNYRELADKLIRAGNRVVVTGFGGDKKIVDESEILKVNGVENLVDKTHGADLISVLSLARVVVAPSTGVAHLAASLGKKLVGLYSPVRVQHPKRWGPQGPHVKVLVPDVECPGEMKCVGASCKFYDCMARLDVDTVVQNVMEQN